MSADQPGATDDLRDELPEDLNAVDHVIAYRFPDNSRRRIPGVIYLGAAAVCVALYLITRPGATLVNRGMVWAAVILALLGVFSITSGWRMHVDEKQALVAAQGALGFPVGHAPHGHRERITGQEAHRRDPNSRLHIGAGHGKFGAGQALSSLINDGGEIVAMGGIGSLKMFDKIVGLADDKVSISKRRSKRRKHLA